WKSVSENPAASPAPVSTVTSKPDLTSFEATSGVTATRFSPGTVSRGTPIFIRAPPMSRDLVCGGGPRDPAPARTGEVYRGARGRGSEEIALWRELRRCGGGVCAVVSEWLVR